MKKLILYLICFGIIFCSGCKKNTNNSTPPSSSNNQSGNYPFGYLKASRQYNISGNTMFFIANGALAYFYSNPPQQNSAVSVGSVWVDTIKLHYQNFSPISYSDSTYQVNICPTKWKIVGAGVIPSFTYTNNDSLPGYSGYNLLPDSIDRTQSYIVQVNGVSGANGISFTLSDGSISTMVTKTAFPSSTNNNFVLSPSDMAGLNATSSAQLQILLTKSNTQTFSGKEFYLTSEKMVNKYIKIK